MTIGPEIQRQVDQILTQYESEPSHVHQVARLVDDLYVGLQPWHRLTVNERECLQVAALLHDIGWSQSPTGARHHKHSAKLIRGFPWKGLTSQRVNIVAQVARYHRRSIPGPRHAEYLACSATDQRVISILAGLLRVADALDRTHRSVVRRVKLSLQKSQITLRIAADESIQPEIRAVQKKKDLLEQVTGRVLILLPRLGRA